MGSFVEYLIESRSADLYHGTSLPKASRVIKDNILAANTPIHSTLVPQQHRGQDKTVSLSRDVQVAINFARASASDNNSLPVVFILDQALLSRDLGKRMRPYDDIDSMDKVSKRSQGTSEREEAVFGSIQNINKYIKRIIISVPSVSAPADDDYDRAPLTDRRLAAAQLQKFPTVAQDPRAIIKDIHGKQLTYRAFASLVNTSESAIHSKIIEADYFAQMGHGRVEYNQEIDYFGMRVMMTPSKFLSLSLELDVDDKEQQYIDKMEQTFKQGESFANPWLEIKVPPEWDEGDFSQPAKIVNHEGRHRLLALQQYKARNHRGPANAPVEVHIILRGYRARNITPEMKQRLNDSIISQRGYTVQGPWFSLNESITEAVLNEFSKVDPQISEILHKKGYKKLGGGVDQLAFLEPGTGKVLKIFGTKGEGGYKGFSSDQYMFKQFVDYCEKNSSNPWLPKFDDWTAFIFPKGSKNKYLQIRMERLTSIDRPTQDALEQFTMFIEKGRSLDELLAFVGKSETMFNGINYLVMTYGEDGLRQLWDTMTQLYSMGKGSGYMFDLHGKNFMRRPDGQIVIIDPWVV